MKMVKYRAKRKDNGELVKGFFSYKKFIAVAMNGIESYPVIIEEKSLFEIPIHPETISLYTTINDKNEIEIYGSIEIDGKMTKGGDIIKAPAMELDAICEVYWGMNCWFIRDKSGSHTGLTNHGGEYAPEVIGNQMNDAELLQEK